jgi:uncharacterized protein (DUF305 family)
MMVRYSLCLLLVASALAQTPAQQPPTIVQPGAPGEPSRTITAADAKNAARVTYTDADVQFMQGMIHHHAQAVEMVELLKKNTQNPEMQKLGQRIEISQRDEIKMMRRWLETHGQQAPDPMGSAGHDMASMPGMAMSGGGASAAASPQTLPMMPGMLTPDQMRQLAAAHGKDFDRLFLEGMIRHHGGALTMVKDLFGTPGAAQDSDIFAFASDVDADQRMEINRMSRMLEELGK